MAPESLLWLCALLLPALLLLLTLATQIRTRSSKSLRSRSRGSRKRVGEEVVTTEILPQAGKKRRKNKISYYDREEVVYSTKSQIKHLHTPCSRLVRSIKSCHNAFNHEHTHTVVYSYLYICVHVLFILGADKSMPRTIAGINFHKTSLMEVLP